MSKLPKFQEPAGELPTNFVSWDPIYRFGTKPNDSKISTIDQFRFNQESPLRQFVQTVSSEEGKQNQQYSGNYYYTSTKDNPRPHWEFIRSEEPLQPMEQEIAEILPGTGDVAEVTQIGKDLSQGNIGNALLGAGLLFLPGNANKFLNINTKLKNIDWKSLRYELDPRYMRVYHATEKPFDIQHFYTGTVHDSGLHVSKKPLSRFGNVLYKLYVKKPSFRFYDTWTNGAQMFNPAYPIRTTTQYENIPGVRMLLDKTKVKYQIGDGFFGPSTIKPTENVDLNLAKLIFPKNPQLQLVLSDLAIKQKPMLNSNIALPGTEQNVIDINKQVSNVLSKNGYDVGVYRNANSYETIDDTYSIFNNDAIKHVVRIKRRGGKINGNNSVRN